MLVPLLSEHHFLIVYTNTLEFALAACSMMLSAQVNSPWNGVISSTLLSFRRRSLKKRSLFNKEAARQVGAECG